MIVNSVFARALHTVRTWATVAALALLLGPFAASPAAAAPSVSTYDASPYAYDATAVLSSPDTVASGTVVRESCQVEIGLSRVVPAVEAVAEEVVVGLFAVRRRCVGECRAQLAHGGCPLRQCQPAVGR